MSLTFHNMRRRAQGKHVSKSTTSKDLGVSNDISDSKVETKKRVVRKKKASK